MKSPQLSILILTEDSAGNAFGALRALIKKMAQLIVPACSTHRIEFGPADADGRAAMHGHMHAEKGSDGHRRRAILARQIVTQLCRADIDGFVAYHTDGDCVWSRRADSHRIQQFEKLRAVIQQHLQNPAPRAKLPPDALARLDRVLLLASFYELESWLFQNTPVAVTICEREYRGRDAEKFREWASNRAHLDEQPNTKDQTCLGARHNLELAERAWPARDVYAANTSFAASVDHMRNCPAFADALSRTAT